MRHLRYKSVDGFAHKYLSTETRELRAIDQCLFSIEQIFQSTASTYSELKAAAAAARRREMKIFKIDIKA